MKQTLRISLFLAGLAVVCQAQIARFEHIIVVFQENRTPDNLFYTLCASHPCSTTPTDTQYNIQTGPWKDGSSASGFFTPVAKPINNLYDLNHSHTGWLEECDPPHPNQPFACKLPIASALPPSRCLMDGASCTSPHHGTYIYVDNSKGTITPYLTLATSYGWANYMFQTNQGPSFPAHQFIFGGTSALSATADNGGTLISENFSANSSGQTGAGCYAKDGQHTALVGPDSQETPYPIDHATGSTVCIPPQNEGGRNTMADLLDGGGWSWTYYSSQGGGTDFGGSIWTAPNALSAICVPNSSFDACTGTEWKNHVVINPSRVLANMGANGGACNLKNVSWVIPTSANSDHPGRSTGGPAWVAAIINTLGESRCKNGDGSSYWDTTAVVITWDDFGGFYDHEPPTIENSPEGGYQLGFRVPMIFVSAYTPANYINNKRHDFGSILRFIEHNFGITEGALGFADSRATTDLTAFYNLNNTPRTFVPIPSPKTALDFINDKTPNGIVDDE